MSEAASFNPFVDAQAQFDRLADLMGLDPATRALLRTPAHEHRLTLPVRLDDGTVEVLVDATETHHTALENILREGPRFAEVHLVLVVDELDQSPLTAGFTVSHERG